MGGGVVRLTAGSSKVYTCRIVLDYCDEINDWLIVGGDLFLAECVTLKQPHEIVQDLVDRGVTHVLDLRAGWDDRDEWEAYAPEVVYHHAPIVDVWGHTPPESWFSAVEDAIGEFLASRTEGSKLYVHCHMGINRGPTAAMIALLTEDPTLDPFDAFLQIRDARRNAGLIYAADVGRRHYLAQGADELAKGFGARLESYWQWDEELPGWLNRERAYRRNKSLHLLVQSDRV